METKKITTQLGVELEVKTMLTAQASRAVQVVMLRDVDIDQNNASSALQSIKLTGQKLLDLQDELVKQLVVSVKGESENVLDTVMNMGQSEAESVFETVMEHYSDLQEDEEKKKETLKASTGVS